MYVYMCMYVRTYVCMYVCMYVYKYNRYVWYGFNPMTRLHASLSEITIELKWY